MNIAPLPVAVLPLLLSCSALQAFGSFDEAIADGDSRFDSKKYGEAKAAYTSALEMAANPDQRGEARKGLTNVLLESGDYEGCRKLAEETLVEYRDMLGWPQANALKSIAESYLRESRTDEMQKTMQRADSLPFKPDLMSWLNLAFGNMYRNERHLDAAKATYLKASANETVYQAWAFYWLARINKDQGQTDEAVEWARKVLALNPDVVGAQLSEHTQKLLTELGAAKK
jgi:tetratricopeptide (TPR) repeat protein